jgi:DNA-binding SARP family transcriptional activator
MEFRILGPLEVVEDGRPVPLERRRLRALLAFLLLNANQLVSSDRVVDEVWGPEPPKTAAASLQNYVSRLRKALGGEAVLSKAGGYVLRVDPERFDLPRFERLTSEAKGADPRERAEKLRAALSLWRGPALGDLAYESFARDEVGRLEEERLAALEECIDAELELGRAGDVVAELEELVQQHPLRERFQAQLMRALYRGGRQADALTAYQAARDVLTEELGLEPGEELRTLQQAILRQDPALATAERAAAGGPSSDRRTVTVLYCSPADALQLASQLDPEAYRALMSRYFKLARDPIVRHGGTLETFIGDAVMAIFGTPELHEDDALRATRAAVDIQAVLRGSGIEVRIGISTGEVHVVSETAEPLHVSGPPASVAARLEQRASPGDVLVDNETYVRVREAVQAEPFDEHWRITGLVPGAPSFARRLDAPFVGRVEGLERLQAAYGGVREKGRACVVTAVGEAGIGKTRLLRELLMPLRSEARILVGRCVSYGEGATYLPIAEVVQQAVSQSSLAGIRALLDGESDADAVARRVAELTGIAEAPAAPGEAFWAVRRFVESLARTRPVVLVLDDIHWAEPTLLDLIEYLGEWTQGRVLVLCAARSELLESRPAWGGPTSTGFVVELGPLVDDEMRQLVTGLADEPVEADVAQRVVDDAGGNPLFAEQLLALARESPGAATETPPNVDALIASRLDQLTPRELAVLRRAAVVGRRFTRTELADLTPRNEVARTDRHLDGLAARALIHPLEHVFAFHHVLVRDVAYRGIPKAVRAELHELAATGADRRAGPDEVVGYHFEQAHRSMTEVTDDDARAIALAGAASEHLGRAGLRAWQRGDVPAAVNLLRRTVALTPDAHTIAVELALALNVQGEREEAESLLRSVAERASGHYELRADLELAHLQTLRMPNRAGDLLELATRAVVVLEAAGDDRALGRAWYCVAFVRGAFFCEYQAMEQAAAHVGQCYRRARWPLSAAVDMLGLALTFGPTPVDEAVARLSQFAAEDVGLWTTANTRLWIGQLEAMRANFDLARDHIECARRIFRDLGALAAIREVCGRASAAVELMAGFPDRAERMLRDACEHLIAVGQRPVLATWAAELAVALYELDRFDDAAEWVRVARESAGDDDLDAVLARLPVEAKLHARRGRLVEAEETARQATDVVARTDSPNRRAAALLALADVRELCGVEGEPGQLRREALGLYIRKGNSAAAADLRAKHGEPQQGGLSVADARSD